MKKNENSENKKFYDKFTKKKEKSKKSQNEQKIKNQKSFKTEKNHFQKINSNAKLVFQKTLFSSEKIPEESKKIIANFDKILQEIKPLNSKQMQNLPENIRNLSAQMTSEKASRRLGYMNENIQLSAYARYFVWWNLVRHSKLFTNLPSEHFPKKDCVCLDLGSGPLTVVIALWLSRPELRNLKLTWYCLDISQNALTLGEDIYFSIAAKCPPSNSKAEPHWKIIRVKGSFGDFIKEKASFVTCANMFNELDQGSKMPPEFQSRKYFESLKNYSTSDAKFILIEPGVPKASRTLCLLRERFLKDDFIVKIPCVHSENCPMNGFKAFTGSSNKWCNFAFTTEDAPVNLQKLSEKSKLPKDRAVLSFIAILPKTQTENSQKDDLILARVTSDSFRLPKNKNGVYVCTKEGLKLVETNSEIKLKSGDFLEIKLNSQSQKYFDLKTGIEKIIL